MEKSFDIVVVPNDLDVEYLHKVFDAWGIDYGVHCYASPDPNAGYWMEGDEAYEWYNTWVLSAEDAVKERLSGRSVLSTVKLPENVMNACAFIIVDSRI